MKLAALDSPNSEIQCLEIEGDCIYRSLFHQSPPHFILKQFVDCHQKMFVFNSSIHNQILWIKAHHHDLLAVEFFRRWKARNNPVTHKIHLLLYLAENSSQHFQDFHNFKPQRLRAWMTLIRLGIKSIWQLIWGAYLNWRLQHV